MHAALPQVRQDLRGGGGGGAPRVRLRVQGQAQALQQQAGTVHILWGTVRVKGN